MSDNPTPFRDDLHGHMLIRFRYRGPLTRKWVRVRYKAEQQVIAETHVDWELIDIPRSGAGRTGRQDSTR